MKRGNTMTFFATEIVTYVGAAYNCKVGYIPGSTNTCAYLLSRRQINLSVEGNNSNNDKDEIDLDINDNSYKVNVLNSSYFDPKQFASYDLLEADCLKKPNESYLAKLGYDMVIE